MPSPSTMNESISSTLDNQNSTPQTYDEERMDTVGRLISCISDFRAFGGGGGGG